MLFNCGVASRDKEDKDQTLPGARIHGSLPLATSFGRQMVLLSLKGLTARSLQREGDRASTTITEEERRTDRQIVESGESAIVKILNRSDRPTRARPRTGRADKALHKCKLCETARQPLRSHSITPRSGLLGPIQLQNFLVYGTILYMNKLLNCSNKTSFKTARVSFLSNPSGFQSKIESTPCILRFACDKSIAVVARGLLLHTSEQIMAAAPEMGHAMILLMNGEPLQLLP